MTIETPALPTRFPDFDPQQVYGMIIDGRIVPSASGRSFRCVDPFEDAEWGYVPQASAEDVDLAVRAARKAFPGWADTPAIVRAVLFPPLGRPAPG
ncbi:aldehyde dehydrogenase family protein [Arthrobacter sp. W4I7]|uniref:aldehyde dehydrogenase family protein n=1 Tax=Arthrobacter sp. W4I7 TaxID=3042296 RepID=UPI0027867542|nr:aldehyde dehydrogenase family protein [Arthrobacter sp. W4I7]MDQ0691323.1 acyl-CoA reductase-like NAD-dependent aldehyde dehydrogenase [Arthrobacter sp. W4I7]